MQLQEVTTRGQQKLRMQKVRMHLHRVAYGSLLFSPCCFQSIHFKIFLTIVLVHCDVLMRDL